jgi:pectate lyase-like protein
MATIDIRGATLSAADPPVGTNPNPDLAIKAPVRAATTGSNITLDGLLTLDGVALAAGDRVLVKDQADATANGLYNAATGPWMRTVDAANNSQFATGLEVVVTSGALNGGGTFQLTAADPVVLGASPLTWARVSVNVNPFVGDSGAGGQPGLVPAPPGGSAAASKFLMASGSFTALLAGMMGFTQAGAGAAARTVDAKLKDAFLCITDFGGAGDNVTDNAAPLNRALTALTGTGGCIFFPPGKYRFNTAVSFNLPAGIFSVALVGSGQDATVLTWPNAAGGITFNYAGISSSVHVRDLSLTTGTANGGNALTLNLGVAIGNPAVSAVSDVYRVTIRGDDGYGLTDYWGISVNVSNVSNVQIENLTVYGTSTQLGIGINVNGLLASSTFAVQVNLAKSTLQNLATGLLYGSFVQGITVDQSNFTFVTNGIGSPGAASGALVQLSVTNSQFNPGAASGGTGIIMSTAIGSIQIANCMFVIGGTNQTAINLAQAKHFAITNNEIQGIGSTTSNGIVIGATQSSSPGVIAGNDIFGFSGAASGIWLQAGSTLVNVYGNVFAANGTNITNSGTNNTIVNNPGYNPVGPAGITVGASPFTYTAGSSPETVYIWGGTVSQITVDKNGGTLTTIAASQTNSSFDLGPFEQIKITYSVAPNINKMIH